jgi:hypothetical protein
VHQKELKIKEEILKTELTLLEKVLQKELKIKRKFSKVLHSNRIRPRIILPETIEDLKIN